MSYTHRRRRNRVCIGTVGWAVGALGVAAMIPLATAPAAHADPCAPWGNK